MPEDTGEWPQKSEVAAAVPDEFAFDRSGVESRLEKLQGWWFVTPYAQRFPPFVMRVRGAHAKFFYPGLEEPIFEKMHVGSPCFVKFGVTRTDARSDRPEGYSGALKLNLVAGEDRVAISGAPVGVVRDGGALACDGDYVATVEGQSCRLRKKDMDGEWYEPNDDSCAYDEWTLRLDAFGDPYTLQTSGELLLSHESQVAQRVDGYESGRKAFYEWLGHVTADD